MQSCLYKKARKVLTKKLLIQELYDATKAGSGSLQFNKTTFNFSDLVQEVIESVQLTNSGHTIRKEENADVEVYADRDRFIRY